MLALGVFFLMGWLGSQSISFGYTAISAVTSDYNAPAFNFLYRVLTPIVFIVIISSIFYIFNFDGYVKDIWLVPLYYLIIKGIYISALNRLPLINLRREALIWLCTTFVSWAIYDYFIKFRFSLLPEPNELKNEFWILIILYLYSIFNNTDYNEYEKAEERRKKYIRNIYLLHKRKYGDFIFMGTSHLLAETIVHTILVYEGFNRPKMLRLIEIIFHPSLCKTIGPMQIFCNKKISEIESLKLGIEKVNVSFNKTMLLGKEQAKIISGKEFDPITNSSHRKYLVKSVASNYNKDDSYVENIEILHDEIIELFYKPLLNDELVYNWRYHLLS